MPAPRPREVAPVEPRRRPLWPPLIDELAAAADDPTRLYLVGGAVRDALRGAPIHDVDIATHDGGLAAARQLADALGGAYYPVDAERGTGRVILGDGDEATTVDVSTFRGDGLLEDLQGRDFTVNAMAARLDRPGLLYDPLDGQGDLFDRRLLHMCRDDSIRSDPIRALRAIRLAFELRLRIDAAARSEARAAAPLLSREDGSPTQPERLRDELFRILTLREPAAALRVAAALGLYPALTPFGERPSDAVALRIDVAEQLARVQGIISPARDDDTAAELLLGVAVMVLDRFRRQLQEHLQNPFAGGRPAAALGLLAAISPRGAGDAGQAWADHLHLSRAEQKFIGRVQASRAWFPLSEPVSPRLAHRYYRDNGEAGVSGVLLMLAESLATQKAGRHQAEAWGALLEDVAAPLLDAFFRRHQQIVAPPPLINGGELMAALSLAPGPGVGRLLQQIHEEQAAGEVTTREEALALARRLLAGG